MAPTNTSSTRADGVGRIRARLLTALHVGKLRPGDRVPSVRSLSRLTGINHKTVHRAYTVLAEEGVLKVRPGSGTFVTERRTVIRSQPPTPTLLSSLARCRDEALRLGLEPRVLARFLEICFTDGLRGVPVGLVECNREQIAIIGRDVTRGLGLDMRPIQLAALKRDPVRALGSVGSVLTTHCHWSEVAELVEPHGVPTYALSLDRDFPQYLLRLARYHDVYVVARDRRFGQGFLRLLRQLADGDSDRVERIKFVVGHRAAVVLRASAPGARVYFAPLAGDHLRHTLPAHTRKIDRCWHVEPQTIETLRVSLALDMALERSSAWSRGTITA